MNAISKRGKVYVRILELHRNITNENVRDSIPTHKIATCEDSDSLIDWMWIMNQGFMPIVKPSPTIIRPTLKDYLFTPDFWTCDCESDWLQVQRYECPECKATVMSRLSCGIQTTEALWGRGTFDSIETIMLKGMEIAAVKNPNLLPQAQMLYKHLKAYNFAWFEAFSIENF